MHINEVLCASVPSAQINRLPMKLVSKVFDFAMTFLARWKRLVRAMQHTQFRAKNAEMSLRPQIF